MMESLLIKHRPTSWDDVIGQGKVVKSLTNAVANKTSHAFLFTGPSGVGKTTAARIAAAQLGCTEPIEIDAATFTGIDDMRGITESLPYRMNGSVNAIIVDECHALSKQAWQALLKSLEEPPEWVFWFLCTTELSKVPATVKTRCLHYDFKPVARQELVEWIDPLAEEENVAADVVDVCVNMANGSPRQALANLAVCAEAKTRKEAAELLRSAEEDGEAVELARVLLGRKGWREVQEILAKLKDKDAESIRRVVCAYCTSVILKTDKEPVAGRAAEILDAFDSPFYASTGISSVARAVAVLALA